MEQSEQNSGFAPRISIPALLGLWALLSFSLAGCPGVQVGPNTAPAGSAPAGQTATAVPGSATLSWQAPTANVDGTPIAELTGYRIHYGQSTTDFDQVIEVSGAGSTTYVINGLSSGTYYFAVSAYNASGIEGALSNIASKSF